MRCRACGAALSPIVPGDGRCPACRQGVRREAPAEALEQAEALLRRIRTEEHPELGRLAASTRGRIEILRRRAAGRG